MTTIFIKKLCFTATSTNTGSRRLLYDIAHRIKYTMKTPISTLKRLYDLIGAGLDIDFFTGVLQYF